MDTSNSSQETIVVPGGIETHPASLCKTGKDNNIILEEGLRDASSTQHLETHSFAFSSAWVEFIFVVSLFMSLAMGDFFISGFQILIPSLIEPLNIPAASQTWPSSVLTLVLGSFLFPMGRFADIYGTFIIFNAGMAWLILWAVVAGFSQSFTMLVVCRALQGLGISATIPSGFSLLGQTYGPGPKRNFIFGLYGCMASFGFFTGTLVGGAAVDLLSWRWYFWIGALITSASSVGVLLTGPRGHDKALPSDKPIKMDWLGTLTIVPGFMLLNYAITDSSSQPQGWLSPQILVCLFLGLVILVGAVYVEGWVAESPLVPQEIFKIQYMKRMLVAMLASWGSYAILFFYSNLYVQNVVGKTPLTAAYWFSPKAAGGFALAGISGLILHRIRGQVVVIVAGVCELVAILLYVLMPSSPRYWAWVFPATIFEICFLNMNWTYSNIYLTTSLPKNMQGVAGALGNSTRHVATAFFLAIANVAVARFEMSGLSLKEQYQSVLTIALGMAGFAIIVYLFIRIKSTASLQRSSEDTVSQRSSLGQLTIRV